MRQMNHEFHLPVVCRRDPPALAFMSKLRTILNPSRSLSLCNAEYASTSRVVRVDFQLLARAAHIFLNSLR